MVFYWAPELTPFTSQAYRWHFFVGWEGVSEDGVYLPNRNVNGKGVITSDYSNHQI